MSGGRVKGNDTLRCCQVLCVDWTGVVVVHLVWFGIKKSREGIFFFRIIVFLLFALAVLVARCSESWSGRVKGCIIGSIWSWS